MLKTTEDRRFCGLASVVDITLAFPGLALPDEIARAAAGVMARSALCVGESPLVHGPAPSGPGVGCQRPGGGDDSTASQHAFPSVPFVKP